MILSKLSSSAGRYLIRVAGSALVLGILFWLLPTDAILEALSRLTFRDFAFVLVAFIALHVVAAAKWWILLDFQLSPVMALRAHFAGLAANLCLPGAIGGDAVRGGVAYAAMRKGAAVVAAGATDRLIDFTALLMLSMLGLSMSVTSGGSFILTLEVVLVFLGLAGAGIVGLIVLPHVWTIAPWMPGKGLALKVREAFAALAKRRLHILVALCLSLGIQYGLVFISLQLATAAGAGIEPGHWLFAWPLAKVIAVLPVSLNGLGVREAALAGILAPLAPATTDAAIIVAAGLMWQAVIFAAGGLGALTILLTPQAKVVVPPKNSQDPSAAP